MFCKFHIFFFTSEFGPDGSEILQEVPGVVIQRDPHDCSLRRHDVHDCHPRHGHSRRVHPQVTAATAQIHPWTQHEPVWDGPLPVFASEPGPDLRTRWDPETHLRPGAAHLHLTGRLHLDRTKLLSGFGREQFYFVFEQLSGKTWCKNQMQCLANVFIDFSTYFHVSTSIFNGF